MKVTFDSNAWETVFAPDDTAGASVRVALQAHDILGFICEAGFRIEAITKPKRPSYFAQPYLGVSVGITTPLENGVFSISVSMGPDDSKHPGLPPTQALKLSRAFAAGVKLMDGQNWMSLPRPPEIKDRSRFVTESEEVRHEREERQLEVYAEIEARGVGKAMFDAVDGWTDRVRSAHEEKQLIRACAEWADAEFVAAHIAYRNDIFCTNDRAGNSGHSIFDAVNRAWLTDRYGVKFMTLAELIEAVKS